MEPIDLIKELGRSEFAERFGIVVVIAIAAMAIAVASRQLILRYAHHRWSENASYIAIAAPAEVDRKSALNAWKTIGRYETSRWSRLLFGQAHLVWEYRFRGSALEVSIWVPGCLNPIRVAGAIRAAWPGATTRIHSAVPPLRADGFSAGGRIRWSPSPTPVQVDPPLDPLRALLEAGPTSSEKTTAVVQVTAQPASRRQVGKLRSTAAGPNAAPTLAQELWSFFRPSPPRSVEPESVWEREQRQSLLKRLAEQCWNVSVRWAVDGPEGRKDRTKDHAASIAASVMSMLDHGHRRGMLHRAASVCNEWRPGRGTILNTSELAQLAHLPTDLIVPALERAGARAVPPVQGVPSGGRGTKVLGRSEGNGRKIALRAADARCHLHVVGKTGTGKSTLLQHLALADIRDHRGLVLIDPKGDLVDDLLDRLDPAQVAGRLYLIDPRQDINPGLAPLAGKDPYLVVDHLVSICRNIWHQFWGPRADDVLRFSLLTLWELGEPLTHLPNLLSLPTYRASLIRRLPENAGAEVKFEDADVSGLRGFWGWFGQNSEQQQAIIAGPVLTRARALLSRPFVRNLVGNPVAPIDLGDVLSRGGIVLARLSKGELTEGTAELLGSILVSKVWHAATARVGLPEVQRRDATLMLDEAHNFLNMPGSVDDMLAEARGLRLSMTLAHQYMAQLPRELQFAVSSSARTKVYFSVSPEDARLLAKHVGPHVSEHDLSWLDDYTAACRLQANGRALPAFTLETEPPAPVIGKADQIRSEAAERLRAIRDGGPASGLSVPPDSSAMSVRTNKQVTSRWPVGRDAHRIARSQPRSRPDSEEAA
jgi:energy-coupling factor transporter ATP-binding protein EcfA2